MSTISIELPISLEDTTWIQNSLKEFLIFYPLTKLGEYKKQIEVFEKKYNMSFQEFEKKVKESEEEIFEEWDDYIIWEGLEKALKIWKKRYEEINNVPNNLPTS